VLQQVAVVAGDLHDQARRIQAKARDRHVDVPPRVLDPGVRVRREVGVLAEDVLRRDELLELHEQARGAHADVERIEALHRPELLGRDVALTQRGHAQVDERVAQRLGAETARGSGRGGSVLGL
jgi:hypothetical protein